MQQGEKLELETLEPVWVNGPSLEMGLELRKMLRAKARVYVGPQPPVNEAPSLVIFSPNREDVASELRRLRALAPDTPILALGSRLDPPLARAALLAGAHGFIHLGMQPAQIVRALSVASKGKTLVSRDLLEALLDEMLWRVDHIGFTPGRREFLELVVTAGPFKDEIVVPRELLEAFLRGAAIA